MSWIQILVVKSLEVHKGAFFLDLPGHTGYNIRYLIWRSKNKTEAGKI